MPSPDADEKAKKEQILLKLPTLGHYLVKLSAYLRFAGSRKGVETMKFLFLKVE